MFLSAAVGSIALFARIISIRALGFAIIIALLAELILLCIVGLICTRYYPQSLGSRYNNTTAMISEGKKIKGVARLTLLVQVPLTQALTITAGLAVAVGIFGWAVTWRLRL